jgi:predicted phosphoribosyltransferase
MASLRREADAVVCPHAVGAFWAVSVWHEELRQVEDAEVFRLMRQAEGRPPATG